MPQTTPLVFVVDDDVSVRESLELLIRSAGWDRGWPFFSDPERTIQKDLDIQEYTDPEHDPMIPYTLVLKPISSFIASTTATGSGGALQSLISGATCA